MANEILQGIADNVSAINKEISNAQELISALSEAGETTVELDQKLKSLIMRKNKWENMLKNRGIEVTK
ncbi:MAG: hypothetical protein PHI02_09310 [Sulfurovaceae bacterium]|nr:hypothetical protein [Sulfurovaceae bacterium]